MTHGGTVKEIELPIISSRQPEKSVSVVGERHDLIEHVQVTVTVSLGSAQMSVGELFALGNGAIVTLDRRADAPVDVRIRDKLIARGVLVAAGDRFGVKLTEILPERT